MTTDDLKHKTAQFYRRSVREHVIRLANEGPIGEADYSADLAIAKAKLAMSRSYSGTKHAQDGLNAI